MVPVNIDHFPVMEFLNGKANPGFSLSTLSLMAVKTKSTSSSWLDACAVLDNPPKGWRS